MTKFFVNEDKKTVVCLITITNDKDLPNQTFVGRAKCSPSDTFDVEKGKDIAYVRALLKLKKVEVQQHKYLVDYYKSSYDLYKEEQTSLLYNKRRVRELKYELEALLAD